MISFVLSSAWKVPECENMIAVLRAVSCRGADQDRLSAAGRIRAGKTGSSGGCCLPDVTTEMSLSAYISQKWVLSTLIQRAVETLAGAMPCGDWSGVTDLYILYWCDVICDVWCELWCVMWYTVMCNAIYCDVTRQSDTTLPSPRSFAVNQFPSCQTSSNKHHSNPPLLHNIFAQYCRYPLQDRRHGFSNLILNRKWEIR